MTISEVDLRRRWSEGRPCHGLWSLLPGAVTGEVLARTGADYVVVDLQHGAVAEAELPGVAAAITAAGSVPLVRTRSPSFPDVGRPLDLGARGVIVPNVRDAAHARDVVAGLDGVYVGPGDLSLSLELTGPGNRAELRGVLSSIIARAGAAGVPVGVHAFTG